MNTIWHSTVVAVGPEAHDMIDGGVFILFATPCPPALAEVAIVHGGHDGQFVDVHPGDRITFGEGVAEITEVGGSANENLDQLGHITVYLTGDGDLLPGAVRAVGTLTAPQPGQVIRIDRGGR